ncbi:ComF family protein [Streptomyces sp. enrichment culture]|uniref:ComF family protein n=1 Tax=Streptomyces sp. enrichment culture TaxID=1795815 RepID=UPI003F5597BA
MLPTECGGCGGLREVLCSRCRTALSGAAPRRVRPVPEPPGLPTVHAAAPYEDEVRAVLLAHKERGALALTAPLGAALAGAVRAALRESGAGAADGDAFREPEPEPEPEPGSVLLVPVPSARRAVRTRGHDPARRIALAAAGELRRTGTSARVLAVLRQRHVVADQSGLDARQRLVNLTGALTVVRGGGRLLCGSGPVVLVDDLMTTGASLTEAARAVRAATAAGAGAVAERAGAGVPVRAGPGESGGGPGTYWTARSPVYPSAAGEGREERKPGPEMAGPNGGDGVIGEVICAAVVAASPDSFENKPELTESLHRCR